MECAQELACPFSFKYLDESYILTQFKEVIITSIFKGGDNSCPYNYRPISLTSVTMQVFERLIRKPLVHYMEPITIIIANM